jgi:mannose-6-phosphate isomerase
MSSKLTHY